MKPSAWSQPRVVPRCSVKQIWCHKTRYINRLWDGKRHTSQAQGMDFIGECKCALLTTAQGTHTLWPCHTSPLEGQKAEHEASSVPTAYWRLPLWKSFVLQSPKLQGVKHSHTHVLFLTFNLLPQKRHTGQEKASCPPSETIGTHRDPASTGTRTSLARLGFL